LEALASLFKQRFDIGMKLPREAKVVRSVSVHRLLQPVAIDEPIAFLLEPSQAFMLWMKAFDKDYGLIRKFCCLSAP
jgi:hypothetical protein